MFEFWTVLYLLFIGVVAGYLARLFVPGRDDLTFLWTMVLGIVGSFVGGFVGWLLFGFDRDEGAIQPGGIVFSVIGAVLALLVWRVIDRRRKGSQSAR